MKAYFSTQIYLLHKDYLMTKIFVFFKPIGILHCGNSQKAKRIWTEFNGKIKDLCGGDIRSIFL